MNQRLSEHYGIRLENFDYAAPYSKKVARDLRKALETYYLVILSLPDLDAQGQAELLSSLGLVADEYATGSDYSVMSNRETNGFGRPTELIWHSDFASTRYPHDYLSLYGVTIGGQVPATRFVRTNRIEAIPGHVASKIRGRKAIHAAQLNGVANVNFEDEWDHIVKKQAGDRFPLVVTRKPIIGRDPHTGLDYLDINPMMTAGIEGYSFGESAAILGELYALLYEEAEVFEYDWQPGSLAVWNNRVLQHSRGPVTPDGPIRTLRRVAVNDKLRELHAAVPQMVSGMMPFSVSLESPVENVPN